MFEALSSQISPVHPPSLFICAWVLVQLVFSEATWFLAEH